MKWIKKDIQDSYTLPSKFYYSESIFSDVVKNIFSNSWQLIVDNQYLSEDKSCFPFRMMYDILPEELLLIRDEERINCYSNVCTHRGNILIDNPCLLNHGIVCGYHGRRFDNCGKFVSMPETSGMKRFPSVEDDLACIPSTEWKQFIFVSLDPKFNIDELILPIDERVGWMPIEDFVYRKDLSKEYFIDCNWALYCDNYLEGFHIPFIHQDLSQDLNYDQYDVETFCYSSLQVGHSDNKDICFDIPPSSVDYGKNIAAYYFWMFPNIMMNFYPWGLSINIVSPLSVNKTKVEFRSYVWNEDLLNLGAGGDVNKVELEDQEVIQKIQRGVKSRFYKRGRFSPKMEKGVHHFHRLIQSFLEEK